MGSKLNPQVLPPARRVVLNREKDAPIGVFITLEYPSSEMAREAVTARGTGEDTAIVRDVYAGAVGEEERGVARGE